MSNEKQTAVEWLEKNMWEHIEYKPTLEIQRIRKKIQQAKEMEKEQIEQAFEIGADSYYDLRQPSSCIQYYNETYGCKK
jgi:hypothetical protein